MANIVRTTHMNVKEVANPEPETDIFVEPYQDDGYDSLDEALEVWALHPGLARMTLDGAHEPNSRDMYGSHSPHDSGAHHPATSSQAPRPEQDIVMSEQHERAEQGLSTTVHAKEQEQPADRQHEHNAGERHSATSSAAALFDKECPIGMPRNGQAERRMSDALNLGHIEPTKDTEVAESGQPTKELDGVPEKLVAQPHDISAEHTDQVKHIGRKRRTPSNKRIKKVVRKHFGDIPVTKEFLEDIRDVLADDLAGLSGESSPESADEAPPSDGRTRHVKHPVIGAHDAGHIDATEQIPTYNAGYEDELERQAEHDGEQAEIEAELAAKRQAELKTQREAELAARREAELAAKREAELEAQRLAELEAQREAELEAKREAELEAKRQAEAKRIMLDELAAEREAEMAQIEARYRAKVAKLEADDDATTRRHRAAAVDDDRAAKRLRNDDRAASPDLPSLDDILAGRDDYPDLALSAEDLAEIDAKARKRRSSGGAPAAHAGTVNGRAAKCRRTGDVTLHADLPSVDDELAALDDFSDLDLSAEDLADIDAKTLQRASEGATPATTTIY